MAAKPVVFNLIVEKALRQYYNKLYNRFLEVTNIISEVRINNE